jgi:hypothetical protein
MRIREVVSAMKPLLFRIRQQHRGWTRTWQLGVTATIALLLTTTMGTAPAQAATKLTCNIGYSGVCTTGSLYPGSHPNFGVFYLGFGDHRNTLALDVIEAGTNRIHTTLVFPGAGSTWHDYRGGFDRSKRYYLQGTCICSAVVVSIENRNL